MRRFHLDLRFPAPPERLATLMTDAAFLEAEARMQDALEARVEYLEQDAGKVDLRIHQITPNRNPLSRDKTSRFSVRYTWTLGPEPGCTWVMEQTGESRFALSGAHHLRPDGQGGSHYRMEWAIDVRVRLGAGAMELAVEKGMLGGARKREAFIRERL